MASGVHMIPKHHLFKHLCREVPYKGNPARTATWLDEGINGLLADIASSNHRQTMERKTYQKFDIVCEGS